MTYGVTVPSIVFQLYRVNSWVMMKDNGTPFAVGKNSASREVRIWVAGVRVRVSR